MKNNPFLFQAIIDLFEDFLENHFITIPNPEKAQSEDPANIYGDHYVKMEDVCTEVISDHVIIDTDTVRMLISDFLETNPDLPQMISFIATLSSQLEELVRQWVNKSTASEPIVDTLRQILIDTNCDSIDGAEWTTLVCAVNAILEYRIGSLFKGALENVQRFAGSGPKKKCELEKFFIGVAAYMCAIREEHAAAPECTFCLVTSCGTEAISMQVSPYLKKLRSQMLQEMSTLGGIDPMLIALKESYISDFSSYYRDGYSAWTTSHSSPYGEVHWAIIPIPDPVTSPYLLIESKKHDLDVRLCDTLAHAQQWLRMKFRTECYDKGGKEAIWHKVEDQCSEGHYSFAADYAFYHMGNGDSDSRFLKIFPVSGAFKDRVYPESDYITVHQKIYADAEELAQADNLVADYSPDFDSVRLVNFSVPYEWEADFGGGWEMSVSVVEATGTPRSRGLVPYAEATLHHNGALVARSFRWDSVSGEWGLQYNGILFKVNILPKQEV